jgi:hypothetical protein
MKAQHRSLPIVDVFKGAKTNIHRIAAGSLANLPCFRVLGNPAPLARAVDGDGTSQAPCRALKIANCAVVELDAPDQQWRTSSHGFWTGDETQAVRGFLWILATARCDLTALHG